MTSRTTLPLDAVLARSLHSGGEMGALVREFDWSRTPLGPVHTWPASLRIVVSILLSTRHPMFLWWGPELIQFYNDGYRQSLGPDRHPTALGQRGLECWAEIWPIIGPEVEDIMAGGPATWHEDHLVPITRGDRVENVYWSYSYSPVQGDSGEVGGVLVTVQETTQRVLAERRKQLIRVLTERLVAEDSLEAVSRVAAQVFEANPEEAGFALVYLVDRENRDALRLVANSGIAPHHPAAPARLNRSSERPWPMAAALAAGKPVVMRDLDSLPGPIVQERWPVPLREAIIVPLFQESGQQLEGLLVAGANPRLPIDEGYLAFFADAQHAIARGFAKVRARELERRTELQLHAAERLQSVGALAGGVAHEVNNQMTVVLGFGEFVLRALGPGHPQAADVQSVLMAGNRAARVSQQLLAFSRQQLTQPRLLRLNEVVVSMESVLRQVLGSDKTLVIETDDAASAINADPIQIEQVLINLVANSRDATETGGRVTLSVRNEELSEAASVRYGIAVATGPYVLLEVADTGHGMEESTMAHIFEPFFTTKKVGEGTGLGLSMVYGIVKRHEGYVWAESGLGQGTTMRLYWPVASEVTPPAEVKAETLEQFQSEAGSRTVWVVEDEELVRALVARALADEGLTVVAAEDGAAAIRLLEETDVPPALVITDLVMPRVNGRQVSDAVRARHPDVPILYMSGYASDDVIRRGLMPENADFLQKPFTPAELVQAIAGVLDRTDVSV